MRGSARLTRLDAAVRMQRGDGAHGAADRRRCRRRRAGEHRADALHRGGERRRREGAAARRPTGLRGRAARIRGERSRLRREERHGRHDLGSSRVRLRHGRRAVEREPEPLAPGEAQQCPRSLPGDRRRLPGARLRRREHELDPRQQRVDRRRPAHRERNRGGGARARTKTSRRRADRRGDLHAQPPRPFRWHRGRIAGGGCATRHPHHRAA